MMDRQVKGIFLDEEVLVQAVTGFVAVIERADVTTGAEALRAFATQDDSAYLRIAAPGLEVLVQAAHHFQCDGIEAGGAVERQVTDMVADLRQYLGRVDRDRRVGLRGHRYLPALLLIFHMNCHAVDEPSRIAGS